MDRMLVYDILYALAAREGREAALFGGCGPVARESVALLCFPAFVKLRWRAGQPLDAKAYLMAQVKR